VQHISGSKGGNGQWKSMVRANEFGTFGAENQITSCKNIHLYFRPIKDNIKVSHVKVIYLCNLI